MGDREHRKEMTMNYTTGRLAHESKRIVYQRTRDGIQENANPSVTKALQELSAYNFNTTVWKVRKKHSESGGEWNHNSVSFIPE